MPSAQAPARKTRPSRRKATSHEVLKELTRIATRLLGWISARCLVPTFRDFWNETMSYSITSSMRRERTMTEDELKFPKWQEPLRQAILEHDPIRLVEKTEKVEATIRERLL